MGLEKLIDLIVQFLEFFRFCSIIDCYERGVRLRFGKFKSELEPGIHFQIPFFVDNILNENVVTKIYQAPTQALVTADGKCVVLGAVISHSIRSIRKALLEVDTVNDAVREACLGTISELVTKSTLAAVTAPDFTDRVTAECRKRGFRFGVEIESVRFGEIVTARTYRLVTGI